MYNYRPSRSRQNYAERDIKSKIEYIDKTIDRFYWDPETFELDEGLKEAVIDEKQSRNSSITIYESTYQWNVFLLPDPLNPHLKLSRIKSDNYRISETFLFDLEGGFIPRPPHYEIGTRSISEVSEAIADAARRAQLRINDLAEQIDEANETYLDSIIAAFSDTRNQEPEAIYFLFDVLHRFSYLPRFLRNKNDVKICIDRGIILVESAFPDLTAHRIKIGTTRNYQNKYMAERSLKFEISAIFNSFFLRQSWLAASIAMRADIKQVVVNITSS